MSPSRMLSQVTPSDIVAQSLEHFKRITILFDELSRRIEPLETTNRTLGESVQDLTLEKEMLEGKIGLLRDLNMQLLQAFAVAVRVDPEFRGEFERLRAQVEAQQ